MLNLRVTYFQESELRRDVDQQLSRGGLLAKVAGTPGLQLRDAVTLEIVSPTGLRVQGAGEVLNVIEGYGVAVTVSASTVAEIRALIATPRADTPGAAAAVHENLDAPGTAPAPTPVGEPEELSTAQKIQIALHGSRDERASILRDRNKSLHPYVLRNPNVTPEEIAAIAKNPQMAPEVLKQIAERKEWMGRSAIAQGLARNPRTPPEIGVRALEYVGNEALRQMAKGGGILPHIAQAARRKVLT